MTCLSLCVRRHGIFLGLRYWLIELLAGDMPVLLNINIVRPKGYEGHLISIPKPKASGLIAHCHLFGATESDSIITPSRDVHFPSDPGHGEVSR